MLINAHESALLSRLATLRTAAFGLDLHIGADFARDSAAEWHERRFAGLASACFHLSIEAWSRPGAWDVFTAARDLAVAFAAVAAERSTVAVAS